MKIRIVDAEQQDRHCILYKIGVQSDENAGRLALHNPYQDCARHKILGGCSSALNRPGASGEVTEKGRGVFAPSVRRYYASISGQQSLCGSRLCFLSLCWYWK